MNPDKCELFLETLNYCGRVYSKHGVSPDPDRISALTHIPTPTTVGQLAEWLGAVGWIRDHIPRLAEAVQPLREVLEAAYRAIGSRRKQVVKNKPLSAYGWGQSQIDAFEDTRSLVARIPTRACASTRTRATRTGGRRSSSMTPSSCFCSRPTISKTTAAPTSTS